MPRTSHPMVLQERDVTKQVKEYLEWHGWRAIRNQVLVAQNVAGGHWIRAGEKGEPDWLFLRYLTPKLNPGFCAHLWVEMKKDGKPLRPDQKDWHRDEKARGGLVIVADDYDRFLEDYERLFGWLDRAKDLTLGTGDDT